MPRRCPKFVSEYLVPSLNSQRFGKHLKWIDKKKSIFQLDWCHKGGPMWTEGEAEVFVEWDKIKGHYHPEDKQYYTKSKQRFRSLLYKLTHEGEIKNLKCDDKFIKVYAIGEKKPSKRKRPSKDSNADNSLYSTDEMSSEDIDMCTDEINWRELSKVDFATSELGDHNYSSPSKSLDTCSDCEEEVVESLEDRTQLFELSENFEKKVLVERNYPCSAYEVLLDIDLQTDFKNVTFSKTEGKTLGDPSYLLNVGYLQNLDENKMPIHLETIECVESNQQTRLQSTELFDPPYSFNFSDFLNSDTGEFPSNLFIQASEINEDLGRTLAKAENENIFADQVIV